MTVQSLLNAKMPPGFPPLDVDGMVGPLTISAIENFQRRTVGMSSPDGRVDPNGRTLQALNNGQPGPAPVPPQPSPPTPTQPSGPVATNVAKPTQMRESAWRYVLEFTKKHEGAVFHMYNNRTTDAAKSDVTCGIGFLIEPRQSVITIPWVKPMFFDKNSKAPATPDQLLSDYDAAHDLLRTGTNLSQYGQICQLQMYPDKVYERMALILRDQKLPALLTHPNCRDDFADFENFPAAAQAFSLSFAYGRIPIDFPMMRASIRAGNWSEAGDRCHVSGMSESKNTAHKRLLQFAQDVVDQGRDLDEMPAAIF
jgi:hypothetical protein